MYDKLIKALRETDFSDGCPCEIEAMLLEASMKLTCAEYEELTEWLREEGLV